MKSIDDIIDQCQVAPGKKFKLADRDPSWAGDPEIPKQRRKKFAETLLSQDVAELTEAQELLHAADSWSILVILQAMDAAGKDGTIKHVMSGVNPQGCDVRSFKAPSAEEIDHTFLWRYMRAVPERGRIGIFNRSYYEEVLIVRVHAETLATRKLPGPVKVDHDFWEARYHDINHFERHLTRNGTVVVKFFLHLSKREQRLRLLKRLEDPTKNWKFSASDLAERALWSEYMKAYEDALEATSTEWAPWYVIPADHKWVSRALVAAILSRTIQGLGLTYPKLDAQQRRAIAEARHVLQAEDD
jgi:PPK2 family polyphosphate:nucleotide phosphotransferase